MERDWYSPWIEPPPWLLCLITGALAGLLIAPVAGFLAITHFECCDWLGLDPY